MENKDEKKIDLDILKHVEALSDQVNRMMSSRTKSAFRKYPLTFTLLVLIGVIAVSEGVKGVLEMIGFQGHPWFLLVAGLLILVVTGKLFEKLDK